MLYQELKKITSPHFYKNKSKNRRRKNKIRERREKQFSLWFLPHNRLNPRSAKPLLLR